MHKQRPPLPYRWEFHLIGAGLGLLVLALRGLTAERPSTSGRDSTVDQRQHRSAADLLRPSWAARLEVERTLLRTLVDLWLAGRAYQFEHAPDAPLQPS